MGCIRNGFRYRWPSSSGDQCVGAVPYVIDPFPPYSPVPAQIAAAIIKFNSQAGGWLRPRMDEADYILFTPLPENPGLGDSPVGRQGGEQHIRLGERMTFGHIMHEIGHAIGLWHEQSRLDRNTRVELNWDNIADRYQFDIKDSDSESGGMVGEYDFGSIMHYGAYEGAVDQSKPTLTTIPPGIPIGQKLALSDGDLAGLGSLCLRPSTWSVRICPGTVADSIKFRFGIPDQIGSYQDSEWHRGYPREWHLPPLFDNAWRIYLEAEGYPGGSQVNLVLCFDNVPKQIYSFDGSPEDHTVDQSMSASPVC